MKPHIFYGWELSYFSGKLRAYLRYKQIPFSDRAVGAFTLMQRIPRHTGAMVMPVLVTPTGEWLQDTTHIIEVLEQRYPARPVLPATPRKRMAALLIEAWADEFWIPAAMHWRWSYPENYALFEHDAGQALLPHAPKVLQKAMAHKIANTLRSYLPAVGVTTAQTDLMERWTHQQLDALDAHLQAHRWLLGSQPCLADFAMLGPLYAHLGRDPLPLRELITPRKHLHDWIRRVEQGVAGVAEAGDDEIPASLNTLFGSIVHEFLPMVTAIRDATVSSSHERPAGSRLPRSLGRIEFPMLGEPFGRHAMPYTLWMMQRIQQQLSRWTQAEQAVVDGWLQALGLPDFALQSFGPPLARQGLHVKLTTDC